MDILPDRSKSETSLLHSRVFPMVAHLSELPADGTLRGVCGLCGEMVRFTGFTSNERESGRCSTCNSMNRQRQIGVVVRELLGLDPSGRLSFPDGYRIHNTESRGAIHDAFQANAGYSCSEYLTDDHPSGTVLDGVSHEDLQALSFDDGSIDLVLSSDVLEHVPDPYKAHSEIHRVLRQGGRHVFTVPFYPWEGLDEVRARLLNGEVVHYAKPIYHTDPLRAEGTLVFTIFGLEMIVNLSRLGFEVSYWNLHAPEAGIIGPWSIVFEARKAR